MSHEPLDRLLGELPRETAGPYFTARVLARLDEPRPTERRRPFGFPAIPIAAALGLAALLAVTAFGPHAGSGDGRGELASRDEARRLLAEIRAEHERLATDLAALREERSAGERVVYLGGDEKIDLMVDLARVRDLPAGAVRPAAFRQP